MEAIKDHRDASYALAWADWLIVAASLIVFGAVIGHEFVRWDDTLLITANPDIRGINPRTLYRAFSTFDPELYIPFTLISYQINYVVAGLQPWIYHLTNLLLHTANAVLVGRLVLRLTGTTHGAILAGLLFAIHPLQTEAVAWASARKDVLTTLFFLSSILLYLRYKDTNERKTYYGSLIFFLCSLLAKVVSVTLPVMLLLIDFLQHRKFSKQSVIEKLPYFALAIAFGLIAIFGKRDAATLATPLTLILIAGKSSIFYLQKLLWPSGLSVIYPYTKEVSLLNIDILLSWTLVIAIVLLALWSLKKNRLLFFATAFYFVTLAPTFTNVIKGGELYYASDRYVYIPLIGILTLIAVWFDNLRSRLRKKEPLLYSTIIVLMLLGIVSWKQTTTWQNSTALFTHALEVAPNSVAAHVNLGTDERQLGHLDAAEAEFKAALAVKEYAKAYVGLAGVKIERKQFDEAIKLLEKAQKLEPRDPEPLYGIALAYSKSGRIDSAEKFYRQTISLEPHHSGARNNLAAILLEAGKLGEAQEQYEIILKDDPTFSIGHFNLGLILEQQGKIAEAIEHYREAIRYEGTQFDVLIHLAPLLAQSGEAREAVSLLRQGLQMKPTDASFLQLTLDSLKKILEKEPNNKEATDLIQWMMERKLIETR